MIKIDCPKCGSSNAYYQQTEFDKILRCLCGYHKVVETKLQSFEVLHADVGEDVKLPKRGTNIWHALVTLASLELANSAEVTVRLRQSGFNFSVSDVSSYLTILRGKGLVYNTEVKRGVAGGSTWSLTDACASLLYRD